MGLPIPLKGETFFSYVTRTLLRSGATGTALGVKRTGLPTGSLWSPLGVGIASFYQAFPEVQSIVTPSSVVWRHTTAPLLIAFSDNFLGRESRDNFANSVISVGGWRSRRRSIGGNAPIGLRDCPECIAYDNETFGVAYWHREHQIRAVSRCWRHDLVLREHGWTPGTRFAPELPGFGRYAGASNTRDVAGSSSALHDLWLANAFAALLDSDEPISAVDVRNHLVEPARRSGAHSRGRLNIEKAFSIVLAAYGADYLSSLDLPVTYTKRSAMRYSRALSMCGAERDSLATLLLAGALSVPHDLLSKRAQVGPRPASGNVQAEEVSSSEAVALQNSLAACGYILGRAAAAMGLSRYELIKAIKKSRIRCPIVLSPNSKFDEATIRLMISGMKAGVPWADLRARFNCSDDILQTLPIYDPALSFEASESRTHNRIQKFRKVVSKAIEAGQARSEIRTRLPTESTYLDRHDREWLLERFAMVAKRTSSAPAKGVGRGQKLDDRSEDARILAVLETTLQAAMALEPPRRVTRTLLVRFGGLKPSLFNKLGRGRYVNADAFLKANEETYEDFVDRKLAYGFRQLEAASPIRPITLVRLRLASGLPEKVLISRRALVEDRVRGSVLPVSPWAVAWLKEARRTGIPA